MNNASITYETCRARRERTIISAPGPPSLSSTRCSWCPPVTLYPSDLSSLRPSSNSCRLPGFKTRTSSAKCAGTVYWQRDYSILRLRRSPLAKSTVCVRDNPFLLLPL